MFSEFGHITQKWVDLFYIHISGSWNDKRWLRLQMVSAIFSIETTKIKIKEKKNDIPAPENIHGL